MKSSEGNLIMCNKGHFRTRTVVVSPGLAWSQMQEKLPSQLSNLFHPLAIITRI